MGRRFSQLDLGTKIALVALVISILTMLAMTANFLRDDYWHKEETAERLTVTLIPGCIAQDEIPLVYDLFKGITAFCPLELVVANNSARPVVLSAIDLLTTETESATSITGMHLRSSTLQAAKFALPFSLPSGGVVRVILWFELELPTDVSEAVVGIYPELVEKNKLLGSAIQLDMTLASELDLIGNTWRGKGLGRTTIERLLVTLQLRTSKETTLALPIDWIPFRYLNGQAVDLFQEIMTGPPPI